MEDNGVTMGQKLRLRNVPGNLDMVPVGLKPGRVIGALNRQDQIDFLFDESIYDRLERGVGLAKVVPRVA